MRHNGFRAEHVLHAGYIPNGPMGSCSYMVHIFGPESSSYVLVLGPMYVPLGPIGIVKGVYEGWRLSTLPAEASEATHVILDTEMR